MGSEYESSDCPQERNTENYGGNLCLIQIRGYLVNI